jgi:hypothetical protein
MPDCPGLLNLATISGYYAQLTGVLAGFAFTALVVLLTPTQVDERRSTKSRDNGVLPALFAAFVALVIASLTYSVLAGDNSDEAHGRAATLELIDGVPFGLAVTMLFQGITLLLKAGGIDPVVVLIGRVLAVVVAPTLTMFYISAGASDTETARDMQAGLCTPAEAPATGVILTWVLMVLLSVSLLPRAQPRVLRTLANKAQVGVPIAVIFASVVAALVGGSISIKPPDFVLSSTGVSLYLVGTFTLLMLLGLTLALGYEPPHESRQLEESQPATQTLLDHSVPDTRVPSSERTPTQRHELP